MTAQLEIRHVVKTFGGVLALKSVDLTVDRGEFVGLIGPNGSGKTTLLNIVSGYYEADSGEVRYDGRRIDGQDPDRIARSGIARSFQVTKVFRRLTVVENLMVPALTHWGVSRGEAAARAREILGVLGLTRVAEEPASSLSGGQGKLLEFGRMMMLHPKLVLLDEPFGGVHPELKTFMYDRIRDWNAAGVTIVLISHDMGSIFSLCTRVVALSYGEIIADGTPVEVRRNPAVLESYLGEHHAA